ncbi:MAG TPA: hypothetical protein VII56_01895 [Rhizomicrobium sp.]
MTDTVVIAEQGDENTGYRFSWGLAIAGGVAATAVTFFLLSLGSGFGLLLVHPITHSGPTAPAFLTGGAIYFLVAQAFGFAVGGHLAGRLLAPLLESPIQEEFRAGAHGLIAWAVAVLATLTVVALAGLTVASTGATTAALYGASNAKATDAGPSAYLVDVLFRPGRGGVEPMSASDANVRVEAGHILDAGLVHGEQLSADDRNRLIGLVSTQARISTNEAASRIDRMQADVQAKTRQAADVARKIASYASLWVAFSLLFGAVVSVSAAIFARREDDRDTVVAS